MPRVSVGLPVFNGERFLEETLDSLLTQTFEDFELIISDNASTDKTEEICKEYAAKDQRIQYYRNEKNLGGARNFNRVFELSFGEYFKWAAHDDQCAPEYLERCVDVLDREPSVLVCHTKTIYIDQNGKNYQDYDDLLDFRSPVPHIRFHDYLFRPAVRWNAIFGVIRANELKKGPLIEPYMLSDQVLLGELILRGKIYRIPHHLFLRRDHEQTAMVANPTDKAYATWFDPANRDKIFLPRKLGAFFGYLRSIRRVRLSMREQIWCYSYMAKWGYKHVFCEICKDCAGTAYRVLTSRDAQRKVGSLLTRNRHG